jgi:hypothetical protein
VPADNCDAIDLWQQFLRHKMRLRAETRARIALSSLGPIGESPDSTDPNQRRLNDLVAKFSVAIKQVAAQHGTDYIPFYERLSAEIAASPGKALTTFRFLPIYGDTFRYFVLRKTERDYRCRAEHDQLKDLEPEAGAGLQALVFLGELPNDSREPAFVCGPVRVHPERHQSAIL